MLTTPRLQSKFWPLVVHYYLVMANPQIVLLGIDEHGIGIPQIIKFPGTGYMDHFVQNLVPGIPYKPELVIDPHINLSLSALNPEENEMKFMISENLEKYEICIDVQYKVVCQLLVPPHAAAVSAQGQQLMDIPEEFWRLRPEPPHKTGGLSRISCWLQTNVDGLPATVVGNITYFSWDSEVEAVRELTRLLENNCNEEVSSCAPVVREHLKIALARLPNYLSARVEPTSPRYTRSISVVTTVFNTPRYFAQVIQIKLLFLTSNLFRKSFNHPDAYYR
jgi:hypothetical protein